MIDRLTWVSVNWNPRMYYSDGRKPSDDGWRQCDQVLYSGIILFMLTNEESSSWEEKNDFESSVKDQWKTRRSGVGCKARVFWGESLPLLVEVCKVYNLCLYYILVREIVSSDVLLLCGLSCVEITRSLSSIRCLLIFLSKDSFCMYIYGYIVIYYWVFYYTFARACFEKKLHFLDFESLISIFNLCKCY